MTAPVHEPAPPVLDELTASEFDAIIGEPLCCTICGGELELRCGEGHLHSPAPSPSPNIQRAMKVDALKTCACGATFSPAPYQRRCGACLATSRGMGQPRARPPNYKRKNCIQCGGEFQPTGPRDVRCGNCRGIT